MLVSINMILEHIQEKFCSPSLNISYFDETTYFQDVRLFSVSAILSPEYLYIGMAQDIQEYISGYCSLPDNIWIIGLSDKNSDFESTWPNHVILLDNSALSFPMLFSSIQDLFFSLRQWDQQLTELTLSNAPIQKLIDASRPFIKNPILIWDSSFHLLASSPKELAPYSTLPDLVDLGRFPMYLIKSLIQKRVLTSHYNKVRNFLVIPGNQLPSNNTLYYRAFMNDGMPAYTAGISASLNTPGIPQLEYMDYFFQKFIEYCTFHHTSAKRYKHTVDIIFINLLEGTDISETELAETAEAFQFSLNQTWQLFAFALDSYSSLQCSYLVDSLEKSFPKGWTFSYNNLCLFLSPEGICTEQSLTDILNLHCASVGISLPFTSLRSLRNFYLQARSALEMGKKSSFRERIFYYKQYRLHHLIEIYSTAMSVKDMCDASLLSFWDEDHKKSTGYADLLKSYLRNNLSITNTANDLHMHRNTVIYRFNHLKEFLGIETLSFDILEELKVSLYAYEFLNQSSDTADTSIKSGETKRA